MMESEGLVDAAETEYRQAILLHEQGSTDFPKQAVFVERLASVELRLIELLRRRGKSVEAEATVREAAQKCRTAMAQYERLPSDSNHHQEYRSFAISYEAIGGLLKEIGQAQEAEKAYRDAQTLWRKLVADSNAEDNRFHLAVNFEALGNLRSEAGRFEDAAEMDQQALAIWKDLVAEFKKNDYRDHLSRRLVSLATMLQTAGQRTEAELLFREAAERADAPTLNGLAWRLATSTDPKQRSGRSAVALAEKAVAATNRKDPMIMDTLAAAYAEAGQFTNAVTVQQEAISLLKDEAEKKDYASRRKLYENNSPYRDAGLLAELTSDRLRQGKFAEAELSARECLAIREREIPDDWRTFNVRSMLGRSLLGQKKYTEAEPFLLSGSEGMNQRQTKIPPGSKPQLRESLQRLVELFEVSSQPDRAAAWKHKLADFDLAQSLTQKSEAKP